MTGEGWWPWLGLGRNPAAGCNHQKRSSGLVGRSRLRSRRRRRRSHPVAAGCSHLHSPAGRHSRYHSRRHRPAEEGNVEWGIRVNTVDRNVKALATPKRTQQSQDLESVPCASFTATICSCTCEK